MPHSQPGGRSGVQRLPPARARGEVDAAAAGRIMPLPPEELSMDPVVLEEMKRYIGFTAADAERLVALGPVAKPRFGAIVEDFYTRLMAHDGTRALLADQAQVQRLKETLGQWLAGVFGGAYGPDFLEQRSRIGRMHVRIHLPQRYMILAMDLIRQHLHAALAAADRPDADHAALDRILDLELAIMLGTYEEEMQLQGRRLERLATIGQLSASMNHDLRSPLGAITTSVFLLRKGPAAADPGIVRHLDVIDRNLNQANRIISGLLDYARTRALQPVELDLRQVLRDTVDRMALPAGFEVRYDPPAGAWPLRGDAGELSRCVANLVHNALEATGGRGAITFRRREERGDCVLEVEDTGPGIAPEHLARVFDPLFTTKTTGTGLGLSVCWRVVRAHGGAMEALSPPGRGALFVLRLPRHGPTSPEAAHV